MTYWPTLQRKINEPKPSVYDADKAKQEAQGNAHFMLTYDEKLGRIKTPISYTAACNHIDHSAWTSARNVCPPD